MFLKILKKDLLRKVAMNVILFIFIALSTLFMAGSVANMVITSSSIEHFGKVSKLSDYLFATPSDDAISKWLSNNEHVQNFSEDLGLYIQSDAVSTDGEQIMINGAVYISPLPKENNLLLDTNDKVITSINDGEIALSCGEVKRNNLELGDSIDIDCAGHKQTFKLGAITKDMVFGTPYMGMKRLIISDVDFAKLVSASTVASDAAGNMTSITTGDATINVIGFSLYSITTSSTLDFERDLLTQDFLLYANFDKDMIDNTYIMDMIAASIFMVVSVILILIALVILRFAIDFTLQEDYREIGVMKAIGLSERAVKSLYMVKYLALALLGALCGLALSFPFSTATTMSMRNNIAISEAGSNPLISILAAVLIVVLVLAFCYLSMRKVDRLSAVQAIRNGASGANYKTRKLYAVHKHRRLPLAVQMAINDILSVAKNYVALIITFTLGTLLVILPINAANTLKSPDITISLFGVSVSDVYIKTHNEEQLLQARSLQAIANEVANLEATYAKAGIPMDFYIETGFKTAVYLDDAENSLSLFAAHTYGFSADDYEFLDPNTAPMLKNEVAMTQLAMEKVGAQVGDTIHVVIGGKTSEYIITASYESMEMMGYSMRFAEAAEPDYGYVTNIMSIQGNFLDLDASADQSEVEAKIAELKAVTPNYQIQSATEFAQNSLSETVSTIDALINVILVVVLIVNCLITVLLMRSFISRDRAQIALLASLGFGPGTLRAWQVLRIVIVLVLSIVLAILLSGPINPLIIQLTFGTMGAGHVKAEIVWQQVYVFYPLILFAATSVAAALSTLSIGKFGVKDIGAVE